MLDRVEGAKPIRDSRSTLRPTGRAGVNKGGSKVSGMARRD